MQSYFSLLNIYSRIIVKALVPRDNKENEGTSTHAHTSRRRHSGRKIIIIAKSSVVLSREDKRHLIPHSRSLYNVAHTTVRRVFC